MSNKFSLILLFSVVILNFNTAQAENRVIPLSPEDAPPITQGSLTSTSTTTTSLHSNSTTTSTIKIIIPYTPSVCKDKRSKVIYKTNKRGHIKTKWAVDSILWCPEDFPEIITCNTIDDTTPDETPTAMTHCRNDGECRNTDAKKEGIQNQYTEFVERHTDKVQGCWAYDRKAKHRPYKIEILCCKQEN